MNIFQEAKQILDKDGKVNALGPFGKGKLTGREVSAYFRRNKVSDPEIKKAVEVALDMGGAYDIAGKEIQKFYGRKIRNSKEVVSALKYANEETFRDDLNDLEEGQFWGQKKMSKAHTDKLKKDGAVMLQKKEKGGVARITLPKGHKDIKKYMKQGYKQIPIESVEEDLGKSPTLDEGQSILAKDIQGLKAISDIEIRFSDEKEWKRMSALVKKELSKPEFKNLPKAYYIDDPLQIGFGHAHKSKAKINIKPIVDLVVKNTKDKQTRLKSLDEGMNSGQKKQFDALYKKMDGGKEHMAIKKKIKNQVKADDAFHALVMKKVMGEEVTEAYSKNSKSGAEVAKMMMKSKTMKGFAAKVKKMKTVTADQLDKMLPDYVSGGDIGAMFEEITEAQYTNHAGNKVKELLNVYEVPYSRMKGEPDISSIEALAKKFKLRVKALKDKVMARFAIDVYGSPENLKKFHKAVMKLKIKNAKAIKFTKAFDYKVTESVDITEGKLGDSIIRKDFPNVWAASAKDRTILKKFHAKVDTKNYKAQKQLYNKNKKAFMSGLGKEKLSSIMKKMTVKKGPMKGWMTDEVTHSVAFGVEYVQEASLEEINLNMPEKVRVQLLTLYNKAMDLPYGSPAFKGVKKEIDKINSKYAVKNESEVTRAKEIADLKDKHKREIEKEKEDIKDIQKDEQVISFFDTYRNMQEEVMDITVDPKNKLPKTDQQNKIAQNIYNLAKTYNCKVAMVGKHLRFKGTKGDMNAIGRAVIGKSSMGNATGSDMTTPQIDKMLNKNLK